MPSMFKGKSKAPELERMNVDTGAELRKGQDFNIDWASRWQGMAPGMDRKEMDRINAILDPRQKQLEEQSFGLASSLQETGATKAMGDFQKYMRSQGMQVAAGIGGSPVTGGFAQSVATKLGMMQTLQNQMVGANLAGQLGNVWENRSRLAMAPSNQLYQANLVSPGTFLQSALTQAQTNTDIANQQKLMNWQAKNTPAPWESMLTGLVTTAAGAAITGGIGAAFAPAAGAAAGGMTNAIAGGLASGAASNLAGFIGGGGSMASWSPSGGGAAMPSYGGSSISSTGSGWDTSTTQWNSTGIGSSPMTDARFGSVGNIY